MYVDFFVNRQLYRIPICLSGTKSRPRNNIHHSKIYTYMYKNIHLHKIRMYARFDTDICVCNYSAVFGMCDPVES